MDACRVRNGKIKLAVDSIGPQDGPTVLFLHAGGETRKVWSPIAIQIAKHGWKCVAPDARGHGESSRSSSYLLQELVSDAKAVAETLCGRPLIIVGGSIGGGVGLILAGEGVLHVAGLVLLDVPTRPRAEDVRFERDRIVEAQRRGSPALAALDPEVMTAPFVESVIAQFDRWSAAARQVRAPVLLLRGAKSHAVGHSEIVSAREDIPQIEIEDLACGHLVARDCPSEVAERLIVFCREVFPS